ncbi:MAG TPA: hypothetical protein VK673_15670 [Chthoniobacterales bacterium]|nr:hypothetical protein [Chthoniobacterales bacterium]
MKIARFLIAGAGVGLCLCAIVKADDDQIPSARNVSGPVVVKRVIVVRSGGDRVIYFKPAYPLHSVLPANRSRYAAAASQSHWRGLQTSGSGANYNHVAKALKSGHGVDTNQSEQQADKDNKSAERKPEAKQPDAKQREANQSEDAGAWDRLTVQAQKEQAILSAEPGGIEPK